MNESAQTPVESLPETPVVEVKIPRRREEDNADEKIDRCESQPLPLRIEAVLLSADRPLVEGRLAELLGLAGKGTVGSIRAAVDELNQTYETSGRSFRIEKLANGWQILTQPAFGPLVAQFHREREDSKLTNAAIETLSIIAYRQPILRAEIEAIRGVACGDVLRGLLERRMIKITGRAEVLGRPMLYGTTSEFLRVFGLANLNDLPDVAGLGEKRFAAEHTPTESSEEQDGIADERG